MLFNYTPYKEAWWLTNPHSQTILASLLGRKDHLAFKHNRVNLQDGDFIDLYHYGNEKSNQLVLLLHGLEGTRQSHYVQSIFPVLAKQNYHCVFMHLRNSGPVRNKLAKTYHAADIEPLEQCLNALVKKYPLKKCYVLGYSLGGAILLNHLIHAPFSAPIDGAIAVSVPFNLKQTVNTLEKGIRRIYLKNFMTSLNAKIKQKKNQFEQVTQKPLKNYYSSLYDYDNEITAPLHGFKDANDYYTQASCKEKLKHITIPTLIIQAKDDPSMHPSVIPHQEELSSSISLITTERGGHVGFISQSSLFIPQFWLNTIIPEYLEWVQM